jgi:hypothetical protein
MELKLVSVRHGGNLKVHQLQQARNVLHVPTKTIKLCYEQSRLPPTTHRQRSLALLPQLRGSSTGLQILELGYDLPVMLLRGYAYILTLSIQTEP